MGTPDKEKEKGLKEHLTIAIALLSIVGAGFGAWTNERINTARLEERVISLENKNERLEKNVIKIYDKLEEIRDIVAQKADRK